MTSPNLNYFFKGPLSKYSHIWHYGLNIPIFGGGGGGGGADRRHNSVHKARNSDNYFNKIISVAGYLSTYYVSGYVQQALWILFIVLKITL